MLTRRQFLTASALGLTGFIGAGVLLKPQSRSKVEFWLLSAFNDKQGQHFAAAIDQQGTMVSQVKLDYRAHEILPHPHKAGVGLAIARRPGFTISEIDFRHGKILQQFSPNLGSHFYGHGTILSNSHQLITTENHIDTGDGIIVFRDSQNYQIIKQLPAFGIGPHQAKLLPDQTTLVVANGGIRTHPDKPRQKLNLASMKPNLSYIDIKTGKLVEQVTLDNHQLSIRHLEISSNGQVIAGLQYQGAKTDQVPLVFSHQLGQDYHYLKAPHLSWQAMKHYSASVAIDNHRQQVAVSFPRGNLVAIWDLNTLEFKAQHSMRDCAGLAAVDTLNLQNSSWAITCGDGNSTIANQQHQFSNIRWDNHLSRMTNLTV